MSLTLSLTKTITSCLLMIALSLLAFPLRAQDDAPEAPPEPNWSFDLGLSYLATSGNSDTSSGGLNAAWKREWQPWAVEAAAFFLRAEDEDTTTAERWGGSLTGARSLNERWKLTTGWTGEKDRFSGIDFRHVLSLGTGWLMVDRSSWKLESLSSLTWTSEELVGDLPSNDYAGALIGIASTWKISESSEAFANLTYFPNFDETDDYRFEGEAGLKASLSSQLAIQLGYQLRYDNLPVPGFDKTDTATTASLVVALPRIKE